MVKNGSEWSQEMMRLLIFNTGEENLKNVPQLEVDGQIINYKQNTKLRGGGSLITKLRWRLHTENVITKARIFCKIVHSPGIRKQKMSLHLSVSSVRSKFIYGQEVLFCSKQTPKEIAKHW